MEFCNIQIPYHDLDGTTIPSSSLWINETTYIKMLARCLGCSKHSANFLPMLDLYMRVFKKDKSRIFILSMILYHRRQCVPLFFHIMESKQINELVSNLEDACYFI